MRSPRLALPVALCATAALLSTGTASADDEAPDAISIGVVGGEVVVTATGPYTSVNLYTLAGYEILIDDDVTEVTVSVRREGKTP